MAYIQIVACYDCFVVTPFSLRHRRNRHINVQIRCRHYSIIFSTSNLITQTIFFHKRTCAMIKYKNTITPLPKSTSHYAAIFRPLKRQHWNYTLFILLFVYTVCCYALGVKLVLREYFTVYMFIKHFRMPKRIATDSPTKWNGQYLMYFDENMFSCSE